MCRVQSASNVSHPLAKLNKSHLIQSISYSNRQTLKVCRQMGRQATKQRLTNHHHDQSIPISIPASLFLYCCSFLTVILSLSISVFSYNFVFFISHYLCFSFCLSSHLPTSPFIFYSLSIPFLSIWSFSLTPSHLCYSHFHSCNYLSPLWPLFIILFNFTQRYW